MESSAEKYGIRQLDGTNFEIWKFRVENLLDEMELQNVVTETKPLKQRGQTDVEYLEITTKWEADDKKARRLLIKLVGDNNIRHIMHKTSAKSMWDALNDIFISKSNTRKVFLKRKLSTLVCKEGRSLEEFFKEFEGVVNDLKSVGVNIDNSDAVLQLLIAMPSSYANVVSAIETLSVEEMTMDRVKTRLLEEELKRKFTELKTEESTSAYVAGNSKKKFSKSKNNQKNEKTSERPKNNKRKDEGCYVCGDKKHRARDCPKRATNTANLASTKKSEEENDKHAECEGFMMMAWNPSKVNEKVKGFRVCLDSGCSHHMVKDKDLLVNLKTLANPILVTIAKRNQQITLTEKGNLPVRTVVNGREVKGLIQEVYCSPDLAHNLLSIGCIEKRGGKVIFENGKATIFWNGQPIAEANREGSIYWIDYQIDEAVGQASLVKPDEDANLLWHKRFGHLSMPNVHKIQQKQMATGIQDKISDKLSFCESCVLGKQTRGPFVGTRTKTKRPLQRIHSDVCGPITPESYDGYKYFVSFIDDYTHMVVIYRLRAKSEVLEKFKQYEAMVTALFNMKIANLRTDGGGEYTSDEFKKFLRQRGIQHEVTMPYTPEQNGIAERMNRTLVEKARSMLADSNLDKELWSEALMTAVFLTNRSPTAAVEGKTPYECWFGKKPNVSNLRVFGCEAFVLIPTQKRKKLDEKSIKCRFVGYGVNGYRLWDAVERKLICSRDVQFNETSDMPLEVMVEMPVKVEVKNQQVDPGLYPEPYSEPVTPEPVGNQHQNDQAPVKITRQGREIRPPRRFLDPEFETDLTGALMSWVDDAPEDYASVSGRPDEKEWRQAIQDEVNALQENDTWDFVDPPEKVKLINARWIFKRKLEGAEGPRCKARLVAKGFMQRSGVDYSETYAPVARLPTVRLLLAVAAHKGYTVWHLDVCTAFLNGDLKENVYMRPPEGINVPNGKVLKLKRSLYGLHQSPRCWNEKFHNTLIRLGFKRSESDYCLYVLSTEGDYIYLVIYVDDMLLIGHDTKKMSWIKRQLTEQYKLKDLGNVKSFMGLSIEYNQKNRSMKISQSTFATRILEKFGMDQCNPVATPMEAGLKLERGDPEEKFDCPYRELIGSLMYLTMGTRPDLCYAVTYLSRFQQSPTEMHWNSLKRILRYVKGTVDVSLHYGPGEDIVRGFTDSDWANDQIDRKSTTGYFFEVYGNVILWSSAKQSIVALSSTEAEYVAAASAAREAMWIRKMLTDMGIQLKSPISLHEDNQGCMQVARNPETKRSKHIDVRFHYLRDCIWNESIKFIPTPTAEQVADILTKPLPKVPFQKFREKMSLH